MNLNVGRLTETLPLVSDMAWRLFSLKKQLQLTCFHDILCCCSLLLSGILSAHFGLWSDICVPTHWIYFFSLLYLKRIFILYTNGPEVILNALQGLSYSILIPVLWHGFYNYPHFTDETPEAWFGETKGPSSHSTNWRSQDPSLRIVLSILLTAVPFHLC